jgi:hypothetical protein
MQRYANGKEIIYEEQSPNEVKIVKTLSKPQ